MSIKNTIFRLIFAIYIGLAIFRLSDPQIEWMKNKESKTIINNQAPTNIKIPKLNLDLAISPSRIKDNNWEVFNDRVAWLSTSSIPGRGNSILYAHNTQGLFANLYKLKTGDEIDIFVDDKWIAFYVTQTKRINPTDIASITSDKNRLTIYTCDGAFDKKRLVVYAE
jgi:LPXTG-site transpeptidase (sortase) family protein